ncbi:hypothetical protein C6I21_01650 [Alkalicoccus urumqiensis]|uniref:Uncharacterized protein n=1 Tax=Alkalicoccus urumqiensis TaxID=1548213 RepID=A0A2P6MLX8_ALKUR|nr:hypothetical protein C6I21_01650 [Alkalicoccus urumqiensis]
MEQAEGAENASVREDNRDAEVGADVKRVGDVELSGPFVFVGVVQLQRLTAAVVKVLSVGLLEGQLEVFDRGGPAVVQGIDDPEGPVVHVGNEDSVYARDRPHDFQHMTNDDREAFIFHHFPFGYVHVPYPFLLYPFEVHRHIISQYFFRKRRTFPFIVFLLWKGDFCEKGVTFGRIPCSVIFL